ncbi:hypothetical protein KC678_02635 [Candidatus Dojkabacteria bacterium]|uniref:Uncharacterized protein n=1 Tax=Candidatus Dojkabacteria bacterium TaxID=2099670 RepID=A0A955L1L9_9BACT|nr:hypothetical protein [Candidatus Dojkabacteria bacterium]
MQDSNYSYDDDLLFEVADKETLADVQLIAEEIKDKFLRIYPKRALAIFKPNHNLTKAELLFLCKFIDSEIPIVNSKKELGYPSSITEYVARYQANGYLKGQNNLNRILYTGCKLPTSVLACILQKDSTEEDYGYDIQLAISPKDSHPFLFVDNGSNQIYWVSFYDLEPKVDDADFNRIKNFIFFVDENRILDLMHTADWITQLKALYMLSENPYIQIISHLYLYIQESELVLDQIINFWEALSRSIYFDGNAFKELRKYHFNTFAWQYFNSSQSS